MSALDLALLAGALLMAGWSLAGRRGRAFWTASMAWAGLAVAQAIAEGFTWQFMPAYGLLAASIAVAGLAPGWGRAAGRAAVVLAAGAAVGAFAVLPAPRLPRPTGPYAVGGEVFRWVDAARPELATPDPADRRNVVAQAWYPAAAGARGRRVAYIDGLGRLPARLSGLPGFIFSTFGRIDTHAVARAPVSNAQARWPVVLFSPGYGAPRAAYSGLAADLASRGYVVLAIDHPYEAAVTELADGRIAAPAPVRFAADDPTGDRYMAAELDLRAADAAFVLDQLGRAGALGPRLAGRLDLARIAMIGHSLGGATAARAMERDRRIGAAANVDGTPYGPLVGARLDRPFLLLQSDPAETHHSAKFVTGNQRLLSQLRAPGWHFRIARANHYSFTDAPLYLAPPARWVLARLIGGERGPVETERATADILDAFLARSLSGRAADPAAAARRYPGVAGGRVSAGAAYLPSAA
jgi:predicted dienelactone hydrolase